MSTASADTNPSFKALERMVLSMPMAHTLGLRFNHIAPSEVELEIPVQDAFTFRPGQLQATPVFAIADGEVVFAGANYSYGHAVLIRHRLPAGSDYPYVVSLYGHLGVTDLLTAPAGATLKRGQMIGRVGQPGENGKSKAGKDWPAHLHFELREDSSKTGFPDDDLSGGGWWGYHSPPTGFLNPTDRRVGGEAPGSGWIDRHRGGNP